MTISFRKTRTDIWVAFGPAAELQAALAEREVVITRKDGRQVCYDLLSLGKTFTVDGVECCYGYLGMELELPKKCEHCGTTKRVVPSGTKMLCYPCIAETKAAEKLAKVSTDDETPAPKPTIHKALLPYRVAAGESVQLPRGERVTAISAVKARISDDDPSIWGSHLLGHEDEIGTIITYTKDAK